jgi:hypothetical protein
VGEELEESLCIKLCIVAEIRLLLLNLCVDFHCKSRVRRYREIVYECM